MKKMCFCILLIITASLLLSGCAETAYRNDLAAQQVCDQVTAALPAIGRHAVDDDFISLSAFGDKYETLLQVTDSRVIMLADSSDTNIDEYGVFHVAKESDVRRVKAILEAYVSARAEKWKSLLESYNPTELPKLDYVSVKVCGRYVIYTILSDADTETALKAFGSVLKPES